MKTQGVIAVLFVSFYTAACLVQAGIYIDIKKVMKLPGAFPGTAQCLVLGWHKEHVILNVILVIKYVSLQVCAHVLLNRCFLIVC